MNRYFPGSVIANRYEVVSNPLMGGMGIVYLCMDRESNIPVALKTFRPEFLSNQVARDHFLREGTTWMDLGNHPNIVRCYGVENISYGSEVFLVLEQVTKAQERADASLRSWLRPGYPLTVDQALLFALQLSRGMRHAVRKISGFVHRDLKPENVLVGADRLTGTNINRLRITDFGLAHVLSNISELTTTIFEDLTKGNSSPVIGVRTQLTHGKAGTPLYMAPEQWRGQPVSPATDIYALGCILYEMLAGRTLVLGDSLEEWEYRHCNRQYGALPGDISDDLKRIIKRCLSSAQEKRYQEWEQVIMALEGAYVSSTGKTIPAEETEMALERVDQVALGLGYGRIGAAYLDLDKAETAVLYFEKSAEIAAKQHDIVTQAVALNSLGAAYTELGEESKAIEFLERSLKLKYQIGEPDAIITTLDNIAIAHAKLGHIEVSAKKWEDALALAREINDDHSEARILSNLGVQYKDLGDHRALKYFERALTIDRKTENLMGIALNSLNLADLYIQQDQDSRALSLAKEAFLILSRLGSPKSQLAENMLKALRVRESMRLVNSGNESKDAGDLQKAIDYYSKALDICQEVGDEQGQVFALGNLGIGYYGLNAFPRAILYFEKAKQLAIQIGMEDHVAQNAYHLALTYSSQDNFLQALTMCNEAAKIWKKFGDPRSRDAQELQAETLNDLGEASRMRGSFQEAIEYYNQSLAVTRDINYRYGEGIELGNLGLAYFQMDDNQHALKYLELAITVNQETGNTEALAKNQFNMALLLHELGKDIRALSFAQESMQNFLKIRSPEVQEAQQIVVALTQLTGKQKGFWGKLFGKVNKNSSDDFHSHESKKSTVKQEHERRSLSARAAAQTYFDKAMVFRQQNSLKEASEYFQKAIAADPSYTEAYYNLGVLHHKQGHFQAAEEFYRKAILIDATFASAHYNLGLLLHDQRRVHEAEKSWQKAIAADPNFSRAYYNLGLLYQDQKRLHDAESFYCKAIEADPKNAEAYMNLGNVLSTQKRSKEAEEAYQKSIRENPGDARAYYNLGNLFVEQKRLDEAESAYRKSISVNPHFADAYQNLGVVLKSKNRLTEANSMFAKARQLDMN